MRELSELVLKTLKEVTSDGSEVVFTCDNGDVYKLYHAQDCCESVSVDDITGDLQDLVGSPILKAEEVSNEPFENEFDGKFTRKNEYGSFVDSEGNYAPDSYTWTFYKFATAKGYVDIRFFGESNGYYSESVTFIKVGEDREY